MGEPLLFCVVILLFPRGDRPPLEALAFLTLFFFVGLLIVLTSLALRVEISDEGIAIFNRINSCTFRAVWSDVTSYERDRVPFSSRRSWIIRSAGEAECVPLVENWPELQRQMFIHLSGPEPQDHAEHRVDSVEGDFKGPKERLIIFGSVGLTLLLAVLAITPVFLTVMGPRREQLPMAIFFGFTIVLFGLYPLHNLRWLPRYLEGTFHADQRGLTVFDGMRETRIDWSELLLIERFERSRSESYRGALALVSRTDAVEIPESSDAYEILKGFALEAAPSACRIESD